MPDVPNVGQLVLLGSATLAFVIATIVALLRLKGQREPLRVPGKIAFYAGIALGVAVLAWHSMLRKSWIPLEDNFDTLVWLAMLLAFFIAYTQRTRPLRGLESFMTPIIVLLLIAAAGFGKATPHEYINRAWSWFHRVSAFGGALAFAISGCAGAMYLFVNQQLRSKRGAPGGRLGNLERLEHVTVVAVTLGFALLTIALITGLILAIQGSSLGKNWYAQPKVVLTFVAWVVYALVMHSPINPSFRGRRTAVLSVIGLVLMSGILIAVQLMPANR
jgi:ABC-type uncharacterized transport system permease subunit